MSLLLTGDRDQALLSYVIQEARAIADEKNGYVGRTALQKIMYFLKTRGISMSYKFDIYRYGPYCQDIVTDTEWLIADDVIRNKTNKEKYSDYTPSTAIDDILSVLDDLSSEDKTIIHDTVAALVPLSSEHLELIATLDYLIRAEKATGKKHDLKEDVVNRFIKVKKDKFPRDLVTTMYDVVTRMVES